MADHRNRPDVHIGRLEVTFEVDQQSGEAEFARLFASYVRRWHDATERQREDRAFASLERVGDRDRPT